MPVPQFRRVAVVGGGVAGLTLAAAAGERVEVVVHEAEPGRSEFGSTLILWPSALRALAGIGALETLRRSARPLGPARLFTIDGRPLTRPHDSGLVAVPRPALLRALREAVPSSVRVLHDEVLDPTTLDADLVVGADGARSRVRGLVRPAGAERRGTPYVAVRGLLPHPPPDAAVGEYWGPGVLVGVVPTAAGGYWFTAHRSDAGPEPLDTAAVLAELRGILEPAAPVLRDIVGGAGTGTGTVATRLWQAPPMPRYVRGRYVLVGDAAHAMTPNLGRGSCDAVLDAVALAAALTSGGSLHRWEARRLPATQLARLASSGVMRTALTDRGHTSRDRLLALSLLGARRPGGRR